MSKSFKKYKIKKLKAKTARQGEKNNQIKVLRCGNGSKLALALSVLKGLSSIQMFHGLIWSWKSSPTQKKIDLKILKPMFFKVLTNGHLVGLCKNFDLRKKQKTEISEIWPLSNWLVSHWLTYLMTSVGNAHTCKKIMKMLKTINHVLAPAWPTVTKPSRF